MKVTMKCAGPLYDPGDDYEHGAQCEVRIGDRLFRLAAGFNQDCPEDQNLGRHYSWFYRLPNLLEAVHAAGVEGEPFELVEIEYA